ncbi:MAG: ABC transporter ATP-binding protein [Desulfofustis sp.]|jgi:ABC-2 type transport system ATP-binding protein|nr:ABC transporter ATP-binding protein [Desulfofustis sp.]
MTEPILAVDQLTKRFDRLTAVDRIDITVAKGEIFGFLGPNGAGKTTTIKMIAGLLLPTSGRVRICGCDMAAEPLRCKELTGYIPDRPYLYEKLTGSEYLSFIASLYSAPGRKSHYQDAEQYLHLFDLWEWRNNLIESYSHGMRQKLIMSSIFMLDQPLIVVDEPMVGLDPKSARIVKELFKSKARAGTAIFLSTHSMEIAEELCHRISIIRDGALIAGGTLDSLKDLAADGVENLEDLFLQLTGSFELQDVVAALRNG